MNICCLQNLLRLSSVAMILATTACGYSGSGALVPSGGFQHDRFPLKVGYQNYAVQGEILGPDWRLANFQYADGAAESQKKSPDYVEEINYDFDDDGIAEGKLAWAKYDLKFVHRNTQARIMLWTTPLSTYDKDVEARVLARDAADEFGVQTRSVSGTFGQGQFALLAFGRTVTSAILQEAECTLGDQTAHRIDMDLADVDQIKLDPDRRFRRVRLVVSKTALDVPIGSAQKAKTAYPVILVAALTSRPEDFDAHLPAFEKLMNEIGIGTGHEGAPPEIPSGFTCKVSTTAAQAPESAPEPPAQPESPPAEAQPPASTSPEASGDKTP